MFFMYTLAMVLHECAHMAAARKMFYKCAEMQLSAFGAVLYGDFSDAGGKDRAFIAMAGPLANAVCMIVCAALWWIFPESYRFTLDFCEANAGMALVNLIPAYPLDGGRILVGILEKRKSYAQSLAAVKKLTVIISVGLFGVFVISLILGAGLYSMGLFAVFLMSGCFAKTKGKVFVRFSFAQNYLKRIKNGVEIKTLVFDDSVTVGKIAQKMQGGVLYRAEIWHEQSRVATLDFWQLNNLILNCSVTERVCDVLSSADRGTHPSD
ncbi:MAG: hypothetical protein NC350_06055 [Corallococcus sp.]|nr:hypothetical protein [Corallococcus sp.]